MFEEGKRRKIWKMGGKDIEGRIKGESQKKNLRNDTATCYCLL
jgi:hypothetical protein